MFQRFAAVSPHPSLNLLQNLLMLSRLAIRSFDIHAGQIADLRRQLQYQEPGFDNDVTPTSQLVGSAQESRHDKSHQELIHDNHILQVKVQHGPSSFPLVNPIMMFAAHPTRPAGDYVRASAA